MTNLEIAKNIKMESLYRAAHSASMAIFESLPLGVQAQFASVVEAADAAAKQKDFIKATEIISTCVVPDALTAVQQQLIAVLQPIQEKAAAVRTARSKVQVNAVIP